MKSKKILLINSPIRLDSPPSNLPHGLLSIASVLRNEGYEVKIFDANIYSSEIMYHSITYDDWDIVGISGLITTYKWQKKNN